MPYLLKEFVAHVLFYVLCLSLLVLHVKIKDETLSHYSSDGWFNHLKTLWYFTVSNVFILSIR